MNVVEYLVENIRSKQYGDSYKAYWDIQCYFVTLFRSYNHTVMGLLKK